MKYIVTGGAGFIGSNLVDRLISDGHEVIVIDNLSSGFLEYLLLNNDKLTFLPINIVNWQDLEREKEIFKNVDGVFHLAAQSRIQPAIKDPSLAHNNNITGMFNVLELMRYCNIPRIVFSSSSSIYGLKNGSPQIETMEPDPLNPYAMSKYFGEKYIEIWCKLYGISGISLRYFNVWGPREVVHLNDVAPVVGLFFRKILKENEPPTIIGDGTQLRDMTHVSDVIEANILAMEKCDGFKGDIFNIGTTRNYSILQFADMVLDTLKLDRSYKKFIPARPAELRETRANNTKAKMLLGWEPKIFLDEFIDQHRDYYLDKWKIK